MQSNRTPVPISFSLGQIVATPGALAVLTQTETNDFLRRHASGDWGDLDPEDVASNNDALDPADPQRLLSAYTTAAGDRIWIITEWDRSVTTLLLPDEY